ADGTCRASRASHSGRASRTSRSRVAPERPLRFGADVNGLDRAVLDVLRCDEDRRRRAACRRHYCRDDCGDHCVPHQKTPFYCAFRATTAPAIAVEGRNRSMIRLPEGGYHPNEGLCAPRKGPGGGRTLVWETL